MVVTITVGAGGCGKCGTAAAPFSHVNRFVLLIFFFLAITCRSRAAGDRAVLDEINLARTQPRQYAAILESRMNAVAGTDAHCVQETVAFLMRQAPLVPLQSIPGLAASARLHVADQSQTGAIGHR